MHSEIISFIIIIFIVLYIVFCPLIGLLAIEAETGKDYSLLKDFLKRACKNWFLTPVHDLIIIYRHSKLIKNNLILKSRKYGIECHKKRNHLYDGEPYYVHLKNVEDVIYEFIHLIPEEDRIDVISGGWVHDVIEDTGENYINVKNATNEVVAEYAYALTNEKGKNRKERSNSKYYQGIRAYKHAEFLKKADRIANLRYSINKNNDMASCYKKEMPHFLKELNNPAYQEMTECLIKLSK